MPRGQRHPTLSSNFNKVLKSFGRDGVGVGTTGGIGCVGCIFGVGDKSNVGGIVGWTVDNGGATYGMCDVGDGADTDTGNTDIGLLGGCNGNGEKGDLGTERTYFLLSTFFSAGVDEFVPMIILNFYLLYV